VFYSNLRKREKRAEIQGPLKLKQFEGPHNGSSEKASIDNKAEGPTFKDTWRVVPVITPATDLRFSNSRKSSVMERSRSDFASQIVYVPLPVGKLKDLPSQSY
jgi:hypothetical protein